MSLSYRMTFVGLDDHDQNCLIIAATSHFRIRLFVALEPKAASSSQRHEVDWRFVPLDKRI